MDLIGGQTQERGARLPGLPVFSVGPEARERARQFLGDVYAHRHGLGLLEAPGPLDKVSLVREFIRALPPDTPIAIVDGSAIDEDELAVALLEQFGFDGQNLSNTDGLSLLKYFVTHKAAAGMAPIVIVDKAHEMGPCACRLFDELVRIRTKQGQGAMRLVLASERSLAAGAGTAELKSLIAGKTAECKLRGKVVVTARVATRTDVRDDQPAAKSAADTASSANARVSQGAHVTDVDHQSGELETTQDLPSCTDANNGSDPGPAELAAMTDGSDAAADEDKPVLIVALGGKVVQRMVISKSKCTIGRSMQNDIPLRNGMVSRIHVLIMWFNGMALLVDLNSRNGVQVNAERVESRVLAHGDMITVGRHRILYLDAASRQKVLADGKARGGLKIARPN